VVGSNRRQKLTLGPLWAEAANRPEELHRILTSAPTRCIRSVPRLSSTTKHIMASGFGLNGGMYPFLVFEVETLSQLACGFAVLGPDAILQLMSPANTCILQQVPPAATTSGRRS
jgi:hypothetical protein